MSIKFGDGLYQNLDLKKKTVFSTRIDGKPTIFDSSITTKKGHSYQKCLKFICTQIKRII